MRGSRLGFFAGAVALVATMAACVPTSPPAGSRLPDLAMTNILTFGVTNPGDGTHALKFGTTVVNVGDADFRLHATRASSTGDWTVYQVVPDAQGVVQEYKTGAGYVYGGDGHFHWHVKNLATYRLYSMPDLTYVKQSTKSGFCFFDTTTYDLTLPGAPQSAVYGSLNCGAETATDSRMGLSIGWGDTYPRSLPGQGIDVTGLAAGNYRLLVTADAGRKFFEKTRANNDNWVDFRYWYGSGGNAHVEVQGTGPQP